MISILEAVAIPAIFLLLITMVNHFDLIKEAFGGFFFGGR